MLCLGGFALYSTSYSIQEENTPQGDTATTTPIVVNKVFNKDEIQKAQEQLQAGMDKLNVEKEKQERLMEEEKESTRLKQESIQQELDRIELIKMDFTQASSLGNN